MRHKYGPMTVIRLLAFMYENKNENEDEKSETVCLSSI